jgi:hypothetical protein
MGVDSVTLALTRIERLEALHGDISAPFASISSVRVSTDLWSELRGVRAPGTGFPRVIAVGTFRGSFGRDFSAVHGRGPGVVIEFDGEPFRRWVVSAGDPDAIEGRVSSAAGLA